MFFVDMVFFLKTIILIITIVIYFSRHAEHIQRRLNSIKESSNSSPPPAQYFLQRADHFQRSFNRTFKQRYWVYDEFYNPSLPGPLFVQFGEEGEASSGLATNMAMNSYGAKLGALFVAIEHRFYGASQVTGDYEDLSLLSVDQGLADFSVVIDYLKNKFNTTRTVVFGCSYIGAGAAWYRAKYPQSAVGAVASSAPVQAVADFYKYLDQVFCLE